MIVLSRGDAIIYCYKPHKVKTIMISISDPNMIYEHTPFCSPENGIQSILELCFADADRPGPDVYGREADVSDLMSETDGRKIAAFISQNKDFDILIHCDAGISRSAGVAGAILKYFTNDDASIFDNPYYYPNMWCYRKTLNALNQADGL